MDTVPPSQTAGSRLGELRNVPIGSLRLDPLNPRLPASFRSASQEELAVVLELGFEAFAVAQSIADNGYFLSEPLLVVAYDDEPGVWIVVEGNRRLTALLGLTVASVRAQFAEADRWERLAARSRVSAVDLVPVVVHGDRASTHVEVGKAHVLGKLQWKPYPQATYIAARVEEGRTFGEVAELIGIPKSKVADLYRDHAIVVQAQQLGFNTGEIEKAFSLLTVAMSSTKLRSHVGAPLGARLDPGTAPIPLERTGELSELFGWIYGSEDAEPVITDSRQISQLGNLVANEVGLRALREADSLDQAKQKVEASGVPPRERLLKRLTTAKNALLTAADDLSDHVDDPQVVSLVEDAEAAIGSLRSTIDEVSLGGTSNA